MEAVEIVAIHRYAFDPTILPPRSEDQPAIRQRRREREFLYHARRTLQRCRAVKPSIQAQQHAEKPWKRHKAVVHALECFHFSVAQSPPLDDDGQKESEKENHAHEDQDPVNLERRIPAAGREESQNPEQKKGRAVQKPPPKDQLGSNRGESARFTGVRGALGPAIQAARHPRASFQRKSSSGFRESSGTSMNST